MRGEAAHSVGAGGGGLHRMHDEGQKSANPTFLRPLRSELAVEDNGTEGAEMDFSGLMHSIYVSLQRRFVDGFEINTLERAVDERDRLIRWLWSVRPIIRPHRYGCDCGICSNLDLLEPLVGEIEYEECDRQNVVMLRPLNGVTKQN